MLSVGDPRRYRLRNGDHGMAATPERAREIEREDRLAFEANPQQRIEELLEALRHARKMALGQLTDDQYLTKQRLDNTFRYLTSAIDRLS